MHRSIAAAATVLAASLAAAACSAPQEAGRPQGASAQAGAKTSDQATQEEAFRALRDLQAAVDETRRFVETSSTPGATTTRDERLRVSEARRAIVVANVALQKARTALSGGDFKAAIDATAGVADRLKAIREGKAPLPAAPPPSR